MRDTAWLLLKVGLCVDFGFPQKPIDIGAKDQRPCVIFDHIVPCLSDLSVWI